jgi:lipoyl(octanoyl) transferase
VDYSEALELQKSLVEQRKQGLIPDQLLLLEHPHVITLGVRTGSDRSHVLASDEALAADGVALFETGRGGDVTYHGPGQLVGYPIVTLAEPLDVVNYVRRIEESLIKVCTGLGLEVGRVDGRSGVWLPAGGGKPARKLAAIGVRVSRATTLHGFALNCDCDLNAFERIVPCGITDAGVTSISAELGRRVGVDDVRSEVADAVCDALDGRLAVSSPTCPAPPPAAPARIVTGR